MIYVSEEWLIREKGSYLPDTYEAVVETINGFTITDRQALHLKATANFRDVYNSERLAGQEWLVTNKNAQIHIKDVQE
jgi:major vault protein